MAESGGIDMPDGRVTAAASTGLVLERVHEPDEALQHALDRSPGTTLLGLLAVSSGDEAGTVRITVRSTTGWFVAVLALSNSGVRTVDPTESSRNEHRFKLHVDAHQEVRLVVLESEDHQGLVLVVDAIRIATVGRGRGIRERNTRAPRTRALPPTRGDFDAITSPPVTRPVAAAGDGETETILEALPAGEQPVGGWPELAQIGASMPPLVMLNAPVSLTVRLARGEVTVDSSQSHDEQVIVVDPDQPLNIALFCRNFVVPENEPDSRDVLLPPPTKELVVKFTVVAAEVGEGEVQVVVRQNEPLPIATLWLSATVQRDPVPPDAEAADAKPITSLIASGVRQFLAPKTLTIDENLVGRRSRLSFELVLPGVRQRFERVLEDKPALIGEIFGAIDAAWTKFKELPTARERSSAFRTTLQALGVKLAADVLPAELRSFFEAHPEQIDELAILTSGETDIPWELVYIADPDIDDDHKDESGFLGRAGLVRWIYNTPHPQTLRVSAGRARYLCPRYADTELALVDAEQELDYLISDFAATELVPGDANGIRALLKSGAIDLLHFGGHGLTDEAADPPRQQLLLANFMRSATESPDAYSLEDLRHDLPIRPPLAFQDPGPLVVLNSCRLGRPPANHSEQGGFAEAFLRGGAAAFVGCLWSVGDEPARDFVRAFYAGLRERKSIAKATIDARREARKSGDTSWLAYTVYAHPDARVEMVGIEPSTATSPAGDFERPGLLDLNRPSPKGSAMSTSNATRWIPRDSGLSGDQLRALHPHVVSMKDGELSKGLGVLPTDDRDFRTTQADLAEVFRTHLPAFVAGQTQPGPVPLVIYAHGGLVDKGQGLKIAQNQVEWWKKNGAYPIHLVWETGLATSLWDAVKDSLPGKPRDLGDFFDGIIETAVRSARGDLTWSAMKRDAEHASGPTGAGAALATLLSAYMRANPGQISVHLIGHSAGAIMHSHLVPALLAAGVPRIASLSLLAPAVRIDTFKTHIVPRLSNIDALTLFTMTNEFEENDTCLGIYKKSLLYLIRGALEPEPAAKILGLGVSLSADSDLSDLFKPRSGSRVEVVWSKSDSGLRSNSQSVSHGGFDNDGPTMNSVARRVLDRDSIVPYPATRAVYPLWPSEDEVFDYVEKGGSAVDVSSAVPGSPQRLPRRRALCIGIDAYPTDRLFGCVSDAMSWQAAFSEAGFETETLLNEQATQARMLDKIRELVVSSKAGDVIALQYSGHGTTIEDLDKDEEEEDAAEDGNVEGGDVEHKLVDEALCPVDFREGHLIIDDDLGEIWDLLPDDVSLTIFFDSCHSGGGQRDIATHNQSVPGSRKRLVKMDDRAIGKYKAMRGTPSRSTARDNERGVFFGACLATEVAYETNSQGDYTSRALPLFREAIGSATNRSFHDKVLAAFGTNRRQTPVAKPPALLDGPLLGSLTAAAPTGPKAGQGTVALTTANGSRPLSTSDSESNAVLDGDEHQERTAAVAAFLRATADLISPR
jgi:hypothetical protein